MELLSLLNCALLGQVEESVYHAPDGSMGWLDIIVIVVYFSAFAFVGFYYHGRNKTTEAYFVGNRSFPGWAIGLSMVGTSISSVTFMGYPADAFRTSYIRLIPQFTLPIVVLIASVFFLPFFRRTHVTTAYEYLEHRFGPKTRVYAGVAFIIGQCVRLTLITYLVSILFADLVGIDPNVAVIIGGTITAFYTVTGGISAVIWTDVVQTVVFVVGGLACLLTIVWNLPGGLGQIVHEGWINNKISTWDMTKEGVLAPTSWRFSLAERTGLMMVLYGFNNFLYEYSGNQNVVQKYCASESPAAARRAMWICVWSSLPIWTYFMFLGTALWVFFKVNGDPVAADILHQANGHKADEILGYFARHYLPPGFGGLVVAAVLAAAMSSLASCINAIATVTTVDIYQRHIKRDADGAHYLRVAFIMSMVASAVMIGGSLVMINSPNKTTLLDTATELSALTSLGLLGLYILGFFTKFGDGRAVGAAIAVTVAFSLYRTLEKLNATYKWDVLPDWAKIPMDQYYTGFVANFIFFAVAAILGATIFRTRRDLTNLTVYTQDDKPLI